MACLETDDVLFIEMITLSVKQILEALQYAKIPSLLRKQVVFNKFNLSWHLFMFVFC